MGSATTFGGGDISPEKQAEILALAKATAQQLAGFAFYKDDQYTEENPLTVAAGDLVQLTNNSSVADQSNMPNDVTSFYDDQTGRFPVDDGDDRIITVRFKVKPKDVNVTNVGIHFDVGEDDPIIIESHHNSIPWGVDDPHPVAWPFSLFCGPTFANNGGRVWVKPDGPVEIYDIQFVVKRTIKGRAVVGGGGGIT